MRKQNGVTLVSLIIYIIVLMLVLAMLANISNMFFFNLKYTTENEKYMAEFNKFNMYFIEDIKNNKNTYKLESGEIIFEDGIIYTYNINEKAIYRNKVKICSNISYCEFATVDNEQNKTIIKVNMDIKSEKFENEYVLRYW